MSFELTHNGVDGARTSLAKSRLIVAVTAALDSLAVVYSQAPSAPERGDKQLKAE